MIHILKCLRSVLKIVNTRLGIVKMVRSGERIGLT